MKSRFGRVDVSSMIVAGDGYAYVAYAYPEVDINCATGDSFISHLRLLQINSAGSYNIINIGDVSAPPYYLPSGEVVAFVVGKRKATSQNTQTRPIAGQ